MKKTKKNSTYAHPPRGVEVRPDAIHVTNAPIECKKLDDKKGTKGAAKLLFQKDI